MAARKRKKEPKGSLFGIRPLRFRRGPNPYGLFKKKKKAKKKTLTRKQIKASRTEVMVENPHLNPQKAAKNVEKLRKQEASRHPKREPDYYDRFDQPHWYSNKR